MIFACFVILVLVEPVILQCPGDESDENKIFIDNDAGADDAFAIFIATLYERLCNGPKLIGVSTGNGNTNEQNVFINNQKILHLANRSDVPIYRGSKSSLVTTPIITDFYGKDGLGDNNLTVPPIPAESEGAVPALIKLSKLHKENLAVVCLKSLTNIALAIKMDRGFLERIGHLYIGAGHIHDKHITDPEFNALMDVESYHVVMEHAKPNKVTLLPFSQALDLHISKEWRLKQFGSINSKLVKALNIFERVSLEAQAEWEALDPLVVAAVLQPSLISKTTYSKNSIVLCGNNRGKTTNYFENSGNVKIIYSLEKEPYLQFLVNLFSLDSK